MVMKVQHKNSKEVFLLDKPIYCKFDLYGYLVGIGGKVFFITSFEDRLEYDEVTDEFIILE